jgi:hypothetical protein
MKRIFDPEDGQFRVAGECHGGGQEASGSSKREQEIPGVAKPKPSDSQGAETGREIVFYESDARSARRSVALATVAFAALCFLSFRNPKLSTDPQSTAVLLAGVFGLFFYVCDGAIFLMLAAGGKVIGSVGEDGLSGRFVRQRFGMSFVQDVRIPWREVEEIRLLERKNRRGQKVSAEVWVQTLDGAAYVFDDRYSQADGVEVLERLRAAGARHRDKFG